MAEDDIIQRTSDALDNARARYTQQQIRHESILKKQPLSPTYQGTDDNVRPILRFSTGSQFGYGKQITNGAIPIGQRGIFAEKGRSLNALQHRQRKAALIKTPQAGNTLIAYLYRVRDGDTINFYLGGLLPTPVLVASYDFWEATENYTKSESEALGSGQDNTAFSGGDALPSVAQIAKAIGVNVGLKNYHRLVTQDLYSPWTITNQTVLTNNVTATPGSDLDDDRAEVIASSDCGLMKANYLANSPSQFQVENVASDFATTTKNTQGGGAFDSTNSPFSITTEESFSIAESKTLPGLGVDGFGEFLIFKSEFSITFDTSSIGSLATYSTNADIYLKRVNYTEATISGDASGNFYVTIKNGGNRGSSNGFVQIDYYQINSQGAVTTLVESSSSDWLDWRAENVYRNNTTPTDSFDEYYATDLDDPLSDWAYTRLVGGNNAQRIDINGTVNSVTLPDTSTTDFLSFIQSTAAQTLGTIPINVVTGDQPSTNPDDGSNDLIVSTANASVYSVELDSLGTINADWIIDGYAVATN